LKDFSQEISYPFCFNYYLKFSWFPLNYPISVFMKYEYKDLDELTQAIRLRLYYMLFSLNLTVRMDFLDFFPFNRMLFTPNIEYKKIADGNIILKSYNKLMLSLYQDPFKGRFFKLGAVFWYEKANFFSYESENPFYKYQQNLPYYAPNSVISYGALAEWTHNIRQYVKRNIQYANKNAEKNYRVYLISSLKKDWGIVLHDENILKEYLKQDIEKKKAQEIEEQKKKKMLFEYNCFIFFKTKRIKYTSIGII